MLAAYAARTAPDDPLTALEVGERPEPEVPDGWARVRVRAPSLNHHDLWSLRGVGLPQELLPMILGCDAAGVDDDGNEVVVHAVIGDAGLARRRDARPEAVPAVREAPGDVRRRGRRPAAQPRPQAGGAKLRGGRLPADGVVDGVPDAVHPARGCSPATRSSCRAPAAGSRRRWSRWARRRATACG